MNAKIIDLGCKSTVMQYTDGNVKSILAKYRRKPETLYQDVEFIRKWLKTQPHITLELSDRYIVSFLIANKFLIERTKERLDMNCSIKSLIPEFYKLPPMHEDVVDVVKAYTYCPLPELTKDLNRVYVSKCEDPNIFSPTTMFTFVVHMFELAAITDVCNGIEIITDLQNITAGWLTKLTLMDIKKIHTIIEKVYSSRIQAIHLINFPSYAAPFLNLIKGILKPKLQKRIIIGGDANSLHKYYLKEILPKDYGGEQKALSEIKENWMKYIEANKDYLEKVQKIRVDENLRPEKLVNDDVLGFHGNFRKLEVD